MTIKLAENLQLLRKEKGLTQEELASIFGVTSQSVSKWELGLSCPDITVLPEIAAYYQISVDELLGYKPTSSINTIYLQMKSLVEGAPNDYGKPDYAYRLARLASTTLWSQRNSEIDKLLKGKKSNNLSYGQGDGGVSISGDNTLFICSFKDFPKYYDVTTIRKIASYLNKLSDVKTLKVLFALFEMMLNDTILHSWTIEEISKYCKLSEDDINKAFNNLDIYFDKEEYAKTGIEKYSLAHVDQVPLLITMLIPSLQNYNNQLKD